MSYRFLQTIALIGVREGVVQLGSMKKVHWNAIVAVWSTWGVPAMSRSLALIFSSFHAWAL
jgi:hypothetical protein